MELKIIVVIVACPTPNSSLDDDSLQGSIPTYATDKPLRPAIPVSSSLNSTTLFSFYFSSALFWPQQWAFLNIGFRNLSSKNLLGPVPKQWFVSFFTSDRLLVHDNWFNCIYYYSTGTHEVRAWIISSRSLYTWYTTTSIASVIHIPDKLMFLLCLLPVETKNKKCSIINIQGERLLVLLS